MHFRLRPSAAALWVRCAGMLRLSEGVAPSDDEDTTVREEGTACHYAAHGLSQGWEITEGDTAPNGVEIDSEMLDAAAMYLDHVASWGLDFVRYWEHPLPCSFIHPQCGGTPDVFAWNPATRTIYVGDLKYGYRAVQPWGNWQLLCYVAGVMQFFGLRPEDVQAVNLSIVQPRNGGCKAAQMTMAEVLPLFAELRCAAINALALDSVCTTNPGCIECDGRHRCPALQNAALTVLDAVHAATPHDLPFSAAENELRVLDWASQIIEARKSGIAEQVKHAMRKGERSKHWELSQSEGRLTWNDDAREKVKVIAKLMGVQISKPEQLITPTQAKKVLGENLVNMHAKRPQGGLKLVPADPQKWARIFGRK